MGVCVVWWHNQVRYFHDTCMGKPVSIFYRLPVCSLDDEQEMSGTWPSRSFWWKIFEPLKGWSGVSHVFCILKTYNTTLHVNMMGLSLTYLDMHCALSDKLIATTYIPLCCFIEPSVVTLIQALGSFFLKDGVTPLLIGSFVSWQRWLYLDFAVFF